MGPSGTVEAIRANGLPQGSLFPTSDHSVLQPFSKQELTSKSCCVVISQSCDLVCPDLVAEPAAELVLAHALGSAADGSFTHAKNPRRLHFHVKISTGSMAHEAHIRDRFSVTRSLLATHRPDQTRELPDEDVQDLISWILARYERTAFPDEFNVRIRAITEQKIKPILKKLPKLRALYVALSSWDELKAGETYKISLLATVRVEDFEDSSTKAAIEKGVGQICAALSTCDGVMLEDSEVLPENEVTLAMIRNLARWNFDYISLRDPGEHVPPARERS